jgi:hypothetical protein
MKEFESAEELQEVLGGFFIDFVERMKVGDSAVMKPGKALNDTNLIVHFELKNPDLRIVIDCEEKPIEISFGEKNPKLPTAVFYVDAINGHLFWLGGLNLPNALIKKNVVLKGPIHRMLKVLPIAKTVFPLYDQYLVDKGFEAYRLDKDKS